MGVNPFASDQLSDHEILRDLYRIVREDVVPQVKLTNGRVGQLEAWRTSMENAERVERAYHAGIAITLRTQWKLAAGMIAAIGGVAAIVSTIAARLTERF